MKCLFPIPTGLLDFVSGGSEIAEKRSMYQNRAIAV